MKMTECFHDELCRLAAAI
ncbi:MULTISPECIES: protein YrbN [Erwiniaceae]|uniref:Protein YrbN n=2 Tax=Erwinia TaxID=551 RepID=A0ABV4EC68_9GAMM|nr:protein YrbN [Erwinia phyllosphaerae]MCX0499260.1 protein YrbN [Erwinia billingiae]QBR52828.1 protein YrbN [Erwinia sp. QL-Z3]RRZ97197.1 protein YrbN [Erwinia sp. 198]HBV40510.1 protein YrbN [Erwinia sp.]